MEERGLYASTEMQLTYFTAPTDWDTFDGVPTRYTNHIKEMTIYCLPKQVLKFLARNSVFWGKMKKVAHNEFFRIVINYFTKVL